MVERTNVEAFILMGREKIRPEGKPDDRVCYDNSLQLWVNKDTRMPIVLRGSKNSSANNCSNFGETSMTKTQEGVDQPQEMALSEFGETAITRTQEGADQTEALGLSEFGETAITETREGADQTEMVGASEFGETIMTATREGHDQRGEISSLDFH